MKVNVWNLYIFISIIIVVLIQPAIAQPLPPSKYIVSPEQFISSNDYVGEYITMSTKIKGIEWSGERDEYTIHVIHFKKEINKSVNVSIKVKNSFRVIDREKRIIRDEIIGIILKKEWNIVVIGKAGELKERERILYVDTKVRMQGNVSIPVNNKGTIILLLKRDEYNEIKDDIPKILIRDPKTGNIEFAYVVSTHKIKYNSSTDIFAVGFYLELSLLDYNSKLLDRDSDDLFDPIDPYPNEYDMDKDNLSDKEELEFSTDPGKNDTDNDGLNDWEEVKKGTDGYITDPLNPDVDGDGLSDYEEVTGFERGGITWFTDPTNPDTDGDGVRDDKDPEPSPIDTDGDGLPDREELIIETDFNEKDTDKDGLTDFEEVRGTIGYKTDPLNKDTDGDGLSDKEEVDMGLNPLSQDTDGDELSDKEELEKGTDPYNRDTDGEGIIDSEDSFPTINNNLIYGLSGVPVVIILLSSVIHIKIGVTPNRRERIKEEREKIEEVKKKILELAVKNKGYIFLDEVKNVFGTNIKTAKIYMKKLIRMKKARKDKKDAYIFPEIAKKYEKKEY